MSRLLVVDIADMALSACADDVLVTYSLGSCIGVAIHDPVARVGGLIHCMLPTARLDENKARERPFMFVDTGMAALLAGFEKLGGRKARAVVRAAGAASILDPAGIFRIGERNWAMLRKVMWKEAMLIAASDIGGAVSRTVRMEVGTGRLTIKSAGKIYEL